MKKIVMVLFIMVLLIPVLGSFAQDSSDGYNPEPGSPQDNECFEGGDWYGDCTTEWHWVCGWYLARYTDGIYGYEQMPTWCQIPEPPIPQRGACLAIHASRAQCALWCDNQADCIFCGHSHIKEYTYHVDSTFFVYNTWASADDDGCYPR